ncbi:MAG: hypothetical protein ABR551_08215 [Gemmatimonadales bacterium]
MQATDTWRPLAWAGYPLAALLLSTLIADTSQILQSPVPTGGLQWRFAVMGFVVGALPAAVLGWGLASITSGILGHPVVARVVSVLEVLFGALLFVGMGVFLLDYLQLRPNVSEAMVGFFDKVSIRSSVVGTLASACIMAIGVSAWRLGDHRWERRRPRSASGTAADKLVRR